MRKKLIGALVVGVGCLMAAAVTYAAVEVAFKVTVKPAKAKKPTALKVDIASSDAAAPQPPIMTRIQIRLNSGGQYNSNRFPACRATNQQLTLSVEACPGGKELLDWFQGVDSKPQCVKSCIGSGQGVGYAKPAVEDPVEAKLAIFNGSKVGGKARILVFVFPNLGPTFVSPGTVQKKRQGAFDYLLDFSIPPIKTITNAPDAAVGTVKTNTPVKRVRKGRRTFHLIVAPKKCTGKWKAQGKFFFIDGSTKTVDTSQACKR